MLSHSYLNNFFRGSLLSAAFALTLAGCAPAHSLGDSDAPDAANVRANAERIEKLGFVDPGLSMESIPQKFSAVDPNGVVPKQLLSAALAYYDANASRIENKDYITIVDFSRFSGTKRMFVVNMKSGNVWTLHVAHGSGSDRNNDGYAERFGNGIGSDMSSLGYYLTAETYSGKHGYSLRIDGLSSTNSHVRERDVVVHGAGYVNEGDSRIGRSNGCFAVAMSNRTNLIDKIAGGSLIYAGQSR